MILRPHSAPIHANRVSRWTRTVAAFALLLASGSVSQALPVTYTLQFTPQFGTGPTPAGSFTYDPANATTPFSFFQVTHGNVTFDLASQVNSGGFSIFIGGSCPASDTAAGVFLFLTHPSCSDFRSYAVRVTALDTEVMLCNCSEGIEKAVVAATGVIPDTVPYLSTGSLSAVPSSSVPEPTSVVLFMIGAAVAPLVRRRRPMTPRPNTPDQSH